MQALLNASQSEDEFVKGYLIDHEKVFHLQIFITHAGCITVGVG